MNFQPGADPETELTDAQILDQCKMYIAALRIADDFGCDAIGIQYQQGLKDLAPASDLAEGLLNNVDRPPVHGRAAMDACCTKGRALPHFNEVDECAGLDALVTNRIWTALGYRSGDHAARCALWRAYPNGAQVEEFVWVFEISGAVPPAHLMGGYAGAVSERQPPMYFRLGGGSHQRRQQAGRNRVEPDLRGWRRAEGGYRPRQGGRAAARGDRAALANHHAAVAHHARGLYGVTRDQLMARHKANHIQVAYAPDAARQSGAGGQGRDVPRDGAGRVGVRDVRGLRAIRFA